jgi:hypothetical protein
MLKNYKGEKLTPNQVAKEIISDKLDLCFYDIEENWTIGGAKPTEKEIVEIVRHLEKHRWAILKKLGIVG